MKALPRLALAWALFWSLMIVAAVTPSAQAQRACAATAELSELLSARYGEQLLFSGVIRDGQQLHLYVNPDGTTWSLAAETEGASCLVASGSGWAAAQRLVSPPAGEEG